MCTSACFLLRFRSVDSCTRELVSVRPILGIQSRDAIWRVASRRRTMSSTSGVIDDRQTGAIPRSQQARGAIQPDPQNIL